MREGLPNLAEITASIAAACLALGTLGALAEPAPAWGQPIGETALAQMSALATEKASRTPAQQKMDSSLIYAMKMAAGGTAAAGLPVLPRMLRQAGVDAAGTVLVDIKAEVDDELLGELAKLGGQVISAYPQWGAVRARLPLAGLETIAGLRGVRFVKPAEQPVFLADPTPSQGDHAHAADAARASFGVAGAGVKVGVLSSGVDSLASLQAAGNLPAGVTVLPGQAGSGDEGSAMLEIVYDLAPAAQLYFATASGGTAATASNIQALRAAGCDIIVDDVGFPAEAVFQDDTVAQAIDSVAAAGALYFSSAGNSGNLSAGTSGTWEGDFANSGINIPSLTGAGLIHAFGTATNNPLTGFTSIITLKWSDPLGASANDYDLYILTSDLSSVVAFSTNSQTGSQDPIEGVSDIFGFGPGETVVVARFSGANRALRVDTNRGRLQLGTTGSTSGHNAAAGAVTVAAVSVATASGGRFTGGPANPVENYSSDGPRRMFLNPDGSAITPGNLLFGTAGGRSFLKPELAAADCGSSATPGFSPFCGTSAAAPHAAAIAALGMSLPTHPSAAQVRGAMITSALDIQEPGPDAESGAGVAMADRTLETLQASYKFFTLTPCRVLDTRNPAGPLGAPSLQPGGTRLFPVAATCGIPAAAKAIAANVTIVAPTAAGDLRLLPGDVVAAPQVTTISFSPGQTRANNAVLALAFDGTGALAVRNASAGTVPFVLDVTGYFE